MDAPTLAPGVEYLTDRAQRSPLLTDPCPAIIKKDRAGLLPEARSLQRNPVLLLVRRALAGRWRSWQTCLPTDARIVTNC
jgi:hypothetical protein